MKNAAVSCFPGTEKGFFSRWLNNEVNQDFISCITAKLIIIIISQEKVFEMAQTDDWHKNRSYSLYLCLGNPIIISIIVQVHYNDNEY